MPLETTYESVESIDESNPMDYLIQRPHYLGDTCALKTSPERFPPIEKPKAKSPENLDAGKGYKNESSSVELRFWLKPGVSLPKLRSEHSECGSGRPEVGERLPSSYAEIKPCINKVDSHCNRRRNSNVSLLCSRKLEQDEEFQEVVEGNIGPSKCNATFKVPSSELLLRRFQVEEKEILEESRALKHWGVWLRRIKKNQDNIKKQVNKKECDLVLNQLYDFRKVTEDKELFTFFKKLKEEEKYRKFPHWVHPPKSKKKTAEEIPPVEYIANPAIIKKEKNIYCRERKESTKKCFFKDQRSKLKPHKPDIDRLAIVGQTIPPPVSEKLPHPFFNIPSIYITNSKDEDGCSCEDRKSVFCLVINDFQIKYELIADGCRYADVDEDFTWEVEFGLARVGHLLENVVRIENRGTIAVEYHWIKKKTIHKESLNLFEPSPYEPWFFFDKNSGIFIPGQKYDLKFYQRAKSSGVRVETWYLKTDPPIFESGRGAKFVLTVVASSDGEKDECEIVKQYLEKRAKETTVKMIVDRLIDDSMRPDYGLEQIEYRAMVSQKDIFEYHNSKHYYNSKVVKQLKLVFMEVECTDQTEWDLSFWSLLRVVRACVSEKHKKESYLRQICQLAKTVLKPWPLMTKEKSKKHRMAYQILCKVMNQMENDYSLLWKSYIYPLEMEECLWDSEETKTDDANEADDDDDGGGDAQKEIVANQRVRFESDQTIDDVEIKVTNVIRFHMMVYTKIYRRLCQAAEEIAGAIETAKFLESWKIKKK